MLVIREAQKQVLREAQWAILARRLEDHLKETLPFDYDRLGKARVHALADRAIERGRAGGITSELDFFRLFNLLFLIGDLRDEEPWAAEILSDRSLAPGVKLQLLEDECRSRGRWD